MPSRRNILRLLISLGLTMLKVCHKINFNFLVLFKESIFVFLVITNIPSLVLFHDLLHVLILVKMTYLPRVDELITQFSIIQYKKVMSVFCETIEYPSLSPEPWEYLCYKNIIQSKLLGNDKCISYFKLLFAKLIITI